MIFNFDKTLLLVMIFRFLRSLGFDPKLSWSPCRKILLRGQSLFLELFCLYSQAQEQIKPPKTCIGHWLKERKNLNTKLKDFFYFVTKFTFSTLLSFPEFFSTLLSYYSVFQMVLYNFTKFRTRDENLYCTLEKYL